MEKENGTPAIDPEEFAAAEKEAAESEYEYTHAFRKPLNYMGKTYSELTFDWDQLTGKDGLAIENELQALGRPALIPTFSAEYKIRMAARACTTPGIGADAFEVMKLHDFVKITDMARSFLLKSEQS